MLKRTLYFGHPAYLKTRNQQLIIELPKIKEEKSAPIEDIGIVILDHQQITVTQALIAKLLENNVAVISCNYNHHPTGMLLNLNGNSLQSLRFRKQIRISEPLKKRLWQQTVIAKVNNQATLLKKERVNYQLLIEYSRIVRSGDTTNVEAKAAAYYWKSIFPDFLNFKRFREGPPPNNLLNYGYSILRALVARSIVASGLHPTFGIFHKSKYDAYCLADDLMEPYRPFVDKVVCDIIRMNGKFLDMGKDFKERLLAIPAMDVKINQQQSPLMNAVQRTVSSFVNCMEGVNKNMLYPEME